MPSNQAETTHSASANATSIQILCVVETFAAFATFVSVPQTA